MSNTNSTPRHHKLHKSMPTTTGQNTLLTRITHFALVLVTVLTIPLSYAPQRISAQEATAPEDTQETTEQATSTAESGMTETQQKLFRDYEIRYFSEVDCPPGAGSPTSAGAAGTAGAAGDANLVGGSNPEIAFNFFISQGLGDIQAAAMVGNFMAESTTAVNPETINGIGAYGIAQWLGSRKSALLAKPDYNTLGVQLNHSWEELTGGYKSSTLDPILATNDLRTAVQIVLERYEVPCRPGSALCASELVKRTGYAEQLINTFGTGNTGTLAPSSNSFNLLAAPSATYFSTSQGDNFCYSGLRTTAAGSGIISSAAATGSIKGIIDTALGYAWPFSVRGLGYDQNTDATPAFQASSANKYTYAQALTDCTIFVATVMRDSGADPDFPIGTTSIRSYLLANEGTKYQIIYQPRLEDLQPGDILQNLKAGSSGAGSWSGHIALFLGSTTTEHGTFVGADASKYTRVPGLLPSVDSMTDGHPTSIAARLIQ